MGKRDGDLRSEFTRDYQRILHNNAYGRLKHKTQVFFATKHDHICTRIEHVNHVASVSSTIAQYLGLNSELTAAIAIGHDFSTRSYDLSNIRLQLASVLYKSASVPSPPSSLSAP